MFNQENNLILPPLETDNFYLAQVGISFALKTSIFNENIKFIPSSSEDFNLLNKIRENSYKIMISPHITYIVRNNNNNNKNLNNIIGNRLFINNKENFISYNVESNNNIIYNILIVLFFLILTIIFIKYIMCKKKVKKYNIIFF